jgi:hypothetical protein
MDWPLFLIYFLFTVAVETPILLVGLSARHPLGRRLFAGVWLNACSYPVVFFVLPALIDVNEQRALYLWVAEIFAPVAECALFWAAFGAPLARPKAALPVPTPEPAGQEATTAVKAPSALQETAPAEAAPWSVGPLAPAKEVATPASFWRDMTAIVLANLASFVPLELVYRYTGWTLEKLLEPLRGAAMMG